MKSLENKIKKLYKLDTYFYQPHYEYSYYLMLKNNKVNFKNVIEDDLNLKYQKKIFNVAEDIYFVNKEYDNKFDSIRIRTYLQGDYKYSANIIFAIKNDKHKEELYVTVHKNIDNIDNFIKKISHQIEKYFNFILKFYIEKEKIVFFIKDFTFKDNTIEEDYLSFAFEEILNVYDHKHNKVDKKFFLSNYILEIEFAGDKHKKKAHNLKRELCYQLKDFFYIVGKKNRKSFEIINNLSHLQIPIKE